MPIIVSEGAGDKVCVDVLDLGWKESPWGWKYRVGLVVYCGKTETNQEGDTFPLTVESFFNIRKGRDADYCE